MQFSPVFPPGYPQELKKYGYPPPFPPGYPPQQYERYGYPPSFPSSPSRDGSSSPMITHQTPTHPNPNSASVTMRDYGLVPLPGGIGSFIPIAGNVYNSGFNVNHSGSQTNGDVQVGNHTSQN